MSEGGVIDGGLKSGQIACLWLIATAHPFLVKELNEGVSRIIQRPLEDELADLFGYLLCGHVTVLFTFSDTFMPHFQCILFH